MGGIKMAIKLSEEEFKGLKGQGFIPQRGKEYFVCRVITKDGSLNSKEMSKVSEIAEKYGRGYSSFTTRLTVEIPWIKYEDIEKVKDELKEVELYSGGTGNRVRPIVACKGTVCTYGLIDTQKLAREVHKRFYEEFYDVVLPHKFKIGIGGCPNNCIKPELNDLGIVAQRKPKVVEENCMGCKICSVEEVCKIKACKVEDGKIKIDFNKCNNCGLCIDKCHFNGVELHKEGVKVFVGGKWGKKPKIGEAFSDITSIEEAMEITKKLIIYYKEKGNPKERFGRLIERVGLDKIKKEI
ncbi:(4Fe-4S)-binding protein [Clostridium tetani]|nr:(4Fe-4S)-binding protein [Clostridium tetani]RXM60706.1 (4Fe-4S)-binding protein [Clostridium tetani]RXM68436.1 (4Fe-4S)-binding protein [Clostridium tetani]